LSGKRLELLKEMVPGLTRVAVLFESSYFSPGSSAKTLFSRGMQDASRQLGLQLHMLGVSDSSEFEQAFASAARWQARALHLTETPMLLTHRARLSELAVRTRLPAIGVVKQMAEAGFLMAYGPDVEDLHWRAAGHVVKILRGARAGDLPFERPSKFDLIINARTAKTIGLTIPPSLLLRATEVLNP
jgi:putative ABC transport system substrate-binding protein